MRVIETNEFRPLEMVGQSKFGRLGTPFLHLVVLPTHLLLGGGAQATPLAKWGGQSLPNGQRGVYGHPQFFLLLLLGGIFKIC